MSISLQNEDIIFFNFPNILHMLKSIFKTVVKITMTYVITSMQLDYNNVLNKMRN